MEIKQVIFSLFQKGSKEGIGILTLRLLFPLRASGCFSQLLGSSNNILTYRFSLNGQKSVLTVMNLLWSASPTHQGSTFFSLFSRMSPSFFFFFVTSVTRATRVSFVFPGFFWPYFTHTQNSSLVLEAALLIDRDLEKVYPCQLLSALGSLENINHGIT